MISSGLMILQQRRNFSFSKATQEYILWLDADDVLLEDAQEALKLLKRELDPKIDAVSMPYHLAMDSNGKPLYCTKRNRLVKRENNFNGLERFMSI